MQFILDLAFSQRLSRQSHIARIVPPPTQHSMPSCALWVVIMALSLLVAGIVVRNLLQVAGRGCDETGGVRELSEEHECVDRSRLTFFKYSPRPTCVMCRSGAR